MSGETFKHDQACLCAELKTVRDLLCPDAIRKILFEKRRVFRLRISPALYYAVRTSVGRLSLPTKSAAIAAEIDEILEDLSQDGIPTVMYKTEIVVTLTPFREISYKYESLRIDTEVKPSVLGAIRFLLSLLRS